MLYIGIDYDKVIPLPFPISLVQWLIDWKRRSTLKDSIPVLLLDKK